ncbi:hypothetical protein GCM10011409_39470 [Lentibacillus populi]|uniref:Uncharacterized protein n=1 Tax=Lentibacillus populi TaxID=1827502 RepID=A0A9W5U1L0_9BACI|nr:hypothetical protein [Lentibacillus populi]GGB58068.1 hypothetical protein GCM10011409_39470 [Lentibacillus populi]
MLKIKNDVKRKNLPQAISEHLDLVPVGDIKAVISLFTFLVLDLICAVPIVADPFIKEFLFLIAPFLIFINILISGLSFLL